MKAKVTPAQIVALAGARWNGVQQGLKPGQEMALFTDPVTRSTLSLPLADVTVDNVLRALDAKRAEYRS